LGGNKTFYPNSKGKETVGGFVSNIGGKAIRVGQGGRGITSFFDQ